jgi:acyl dehydratase
MTIDPTSVGRTGTPTLHRWDSTDTLLYALGVGAGTEDLAFTTENTTGVAQQVLPTFGVVIGSAPAVLALAGTFDPAKLVHGSQAIETFGAIPVAGEVRVTGRIDEVQDKGSAAVVVISADAVDIATDQLLLTTRTTAFIRGEGGFGGERGVTERIDVPGRPPDHVVEDRTHPEQALIYRLSGDRNPLHTDSAFAARGGFDRPILHGLCTYGFAGRALLDTVVDGDPARFGRMEARFSAPVLPGDRLVTEMWDTDDGVLFRTRRNGDEVVLDGGRFRPAAGPG